MSPFEIARLVRCAVRTHVSLLCVALFGYPEATFEPDVIA